MNTDFFAGILIGSILSLLTVAIIKAIIPDEHYDDKTCMETFRDCALMEEE